MMVCLILASVSRLLLICSLNVSFYKDFVSRRLLVFDADDDNEEEELLALEW